MQIETTVNKAALLRYSTNIQATAAEYVRLIALADKLADQIKAALGASKAHVLPDGGFAAMENGPITLDLTAQDVNNLAVCMERFSWPFDRFTAEMRREVTELFSTDIPSWVAQANVEAEMERMTPAQKQVIARKARAK